jgi:hypothetical protein
VREATSTGLTEIKGRNGQLFRPLFFISDGKQNTGGFEPDWPPELPHLFRQLAANKNPSPLAREGVLIFQFELSP